MGNSYLIHKSNSNVSLNSSHIEEEYSEATVRFAVTDNIIKVICEVSGCKIKLEDIVQKSDELMTSRRSETASNVVSSKSLSDYVMYCVIRGHNIKLVIVEVKTDHKLSSDSIAQTIGYYISSKVALECTPMALLLTQSKAQLIFFPFLSRDGVSVNAVVTRPFDVTKLTTFFAVTAFVSRYNILFYPNQRELVLDVQDYVQRKHTQNF